MVMKKSRFPIWLNNISEHYKGLPHLLINAWTQLFMYTLPFYNIMTQILFFFCRTNISIQQNFDPLYLWWLCFFQIVCLFNHFSMGLSCLLDNHWQYSLAIFSKNLLSGIFASKWLEWTKNLWHIYIYINSA